jgi:hypothetical protein
MASAIEPLLKVRYGKFSNPLPSEDTIAKFAPFVPKESRDGRSFNFPVYLGLPGGVTHDDTRTAFTLNSVVASVVKEATLSGASIMLRDNVAYDDVFATMNGIADGGGAGGAYMSAWDHCTYGLMQAGELYREIALLYGPGPTSTAASSIGTVANSVSGANLAAPQVVNLTTASWAPGLWPNMIGQIVDIYQSDGATLRAAGVTVTNMTAATNRLTLTKAASGATVATGDIIVARGALDVSCYGLEAICANTGTLFGISATTYPQWRVSSHSAGSLPLDRAQIQGLTSRQAARGMKNGGTLFVSPPAVADLIEEASELQRFNDASDTKRQGASKLVYTTTCGDITVVGHPYFKQGIGMLLPNDSVKRVGSTDLTFSHGKNEWFLTELADNAGTQMRCYMNFAPIIENPWHAVYITGIVPTYATAPA